LAQERAENVKRYLVEHFAIVLERLLVQGYGASQPRVTNTSPEGREQNRRVEVVPLGQASSAH
jgi:outer membrane protein OmpA-like peptidoglycan-associated protein